MGTARINISKSLLIHPSSQTHLLTFSLQNHSFDSVQEFRLQIPFQIVLLEVFAADELVVYVVLLRQGAKLEPFFVPAYAYRYFVVGYLLKWVYYLAVRFGRPIAANDTDFRHFSGEETQFLNKIKILNAETRTKNENAKVCIFFGMACRKETKMQNDAQ